MTHRPPNRRVSLGAEDVQALRKLVQFADKADRSAPDYKTLLCQKEKALPDAAGVAWHYWPSDDLRASLKRWVSAYSIERTRLGFRVCRFIKARGRYAKRPERAPRDGWTDAQIAKLRFLIRVPASAI